MNAPDALPPEGLAVIAERPNAKLRAPMIVGGMLEHYPTAVARLDPATVVLWPWPGHWRTDVFVTTAGDIAQAIAEAAERAA